MSAIDQPPDQPVRVAIDVGPLYGHRTGVGVATAGILQALAGRHDVVLDPFLVSFRARPRPGHRRLPVPGIVASLVWARSDRPGIDRWARHVDVVHGTNYVVPPSTVPSVVSVYDCWFLRHPELASPVVRRAGDRLRRAVARGGYVHASSEATADEVKHLLSTDRVETIALGPPPAPPAAAAVETPPGLAGVGRRRMIVAIGTEERRKDIPMLVDAFRQMAARRDDVELVLAGAPGDDSEAVERSLAGLTDATAGRVRRLGAIDDAAKHWLMRRAAVLAYPSLDEGFGFPILEAQLAATPVVASDVGAVAEIAGDGAVLVAGRDPAEFAAALDRTLDDGTLRLGLIEAGHRNVRRYSWEHTGARLAALYRRVAADR
jgi:glycosyltransferase involved in cell wall biosynthesis